MFPVLLTDGGPVAPDGPKLRAGKRHRARDVHLAEEGGDARARVDQITDCGDKNIAG